MKAHIIFDGVVINTIEVKSLDFMPGLVDASLGGKIGDLYDGVNFEHQVNQKEIEDEKRRLYYQNVNVTFPDGAGEIKFQNDADRLDFLCVLQMSMAMVLDNDLSIINYQTVDGVIHKVTATQMMALFLEVLINKQAIIVTIAQKVEAK